MDRIPRVTFDMFPHCVGRYVRMVGKVLHAVEGGVAMQACDGGQLLVQSGNPGAYGSSPIVEVIGVVNADMSLQETTVIPFSENFDLELYSRMVKTAQTNFAFMF